MSPTQSQRGTADCSREGVTEKVMFLPHCGDTGQDPGKLAQPSELAPLCLSYWVTGAMQLASCVCKCVLFSEATSVKKKMEGIQEKGEENPNYKPLVEDRAQGAVSYLCHQKNARQIVVPWLITHLTNWWRNVTERKVSARWQLTFQGWSDCVQIGAGIARVCQKGGLSQETHNVKLRKGIHYFYWFSQFPGQQQMVEVYVQLCLDRRALSSCGKRWTRSGPHSAQQVKFPVSNYS